MAKRDPRNPLMSAANKQFGPLSDENMQSSYASGIGMPPSADYFDSQAGRQEIGEAMKLANENKMHAMNGEVPMSPQAWLMQAWNNLQKGYDNHVDKWLTMTDRDADLKSKQMAWNIGKSMEQTERRRQASPAAPGQGNPARGIPAGAPQPKPPQGGQGR